MSELYELVCVVGIIGTGRLTILLVLATNPEVRKTVLHRPPKRKKLPQAWTTPFPSQPYLLHLLRYQETPTVYTSDKEIGWGLKTWQFYGYWADGARVPPLPVDRVRPLWRCRMLSDRQRTKIALVPLRQPWHYEVHTRLGRTGLTIGPIEAGPTNGGCRVIGWGIRYTGRVLAGPYDFIEEAQLLAMLLACFDWSREPECFSRREVLEIKGVIQTFRAELAHHRATYENPRSPAFLDAR